jgi:hypothetical protein
MNRVQHRNLKDMIIDLSDSEVWLTNHLRDEIQYNKRFSHELYLFLT